VTQETSPDEPPLVARRQSSVFEPFEGTDALLRWRQGVDTRSRRELATARSFGLMIQRAASQAPQPRPTVRPVGPAGRGLSWPTVSKDTVPRPTLTPTLTVDPNPNPNPNPNPDPDPNPNPNSNQVPGLLLCNNKKFAGPQDLSDHLSRCQVVGKRRPSMVQRQAMRLLALEHFLPTIFLEAGWGMPWLTQPSPSPSPSPSA
jgi:hypothetical protein